MEFLPPKLTVLWDIADELGRSRSTDPDYVLDPVGLLLQRPLKRWEYSCTPLNTLTFAHTGGDGVHFGLLDLEGSPVVITVPMADRHNFVIAEDFDEFLGIGTLNGWFSLEQVANDIEWAIRYFNTPDPEPWPEREELLRILRERLNITPVSLSRTRLDDLHLRFHSLVQTSGNQD